MATAKATTPVAAPVPQHHVSTSLALSHTSRLLKRQVESLLLGSPLAHTKGTVSCCSVPRSIPLSLCCSLPPSIPLSWWLPFDSVEHCGATTGGRPPAYASLLRAVTALASISEKVLQCRSSEGTVLCYVDVSQEFNWIVVPFRPSCVNISIVCWIWLLVSLNLVFSIVNNVRW
jgi:hypothetical protein